MSKIQQVRAILDHIQQINSEPVFHPGISPGEAALFFDQIALTPSPEILQLYRLHNGIDCLNGFLHFFKIQDAISTYNVFKQCKEEDLSFKWQPSWFPFLTQNGDITICLDIETQQLAAIDLECSCEDVIADHYGNYLNAIHEMFELEEYEFDEFSGCIEFSPDAWEAAMKHHGLKEIWVHES